MFKDLLTSFIVFAANSASSRSTWGGLYQPLPLGTVVFGPLADTIDIHYIFILNGSIVIFFGAYWLRLTRKIREIQENKIIKI